GPPRINRRRRASHCSTIGRRARHSRRSDSLPSQAVSLIIGHRIAIPPRLVGVLGPHFDTGPRHRAPPSTLPYALRRRLLQESAKIKFFLPRGLSRRYDRPPGLTGCPEPEHGPATEGQAHGPTATRPTSQPDRDPLDGRGAGPPRPGRCGGRGP